MDDLDAAGRRLAGWHAGPTPPVDRIFRRAKRRRRKRVAARVGASFALAAAAAGIVASVPALRSPTTVVSGAPNPLASAPHPRGWVPVDLGRLRVWAPDLDVCGGITGSSGGADISVTSGCQSPFPPSPSQPVEVVAAAVRPSGDRTTLDGLSVWVSGPRVRLVGGRLDTAALLAGANRSITSFDVPSLGVRLLALGSSGARLALTLGPSPLDAVLATTYPVAIPSGWRSVSFDGVTLSVPPSWAVTKLTRAPLEALPGQPLVPCELFPRPVVYLGGPAGSCSTGFAGGIGDPPGLWLGNAVAALSGPSNRTSTLRSAAGASATIRWSPFAGSSTVDVTLVAGGHSVAATMGIGSDPVIAEEILSSLRVAG